MKTLKIIFVSLVFILTISTNAQDFENATIEAHKLTDNIFMLVGYGGNIGVSVGEDGTFMIDNQFAELTQKINTVIKGISNKPINYLVNTHHHGDHVGGNENINKLGATIISHDNVRKNLVSNEKPIKALPTITYNDKMNIFINGEKVSIFHVSNAHTNGDSLLLFTNSNVLHTGDTYFNGMYPFIDLNDGGSVNGYINAVKQTLILIDDETQIIPGHGKLSNKSEYKEFLKMLEHIKRNVLLEIKNGKTEEEVANNSSITKTYDDLGYNWNFISSEKIRRTFYKSLKN